MDTYYPHDYDSSIRHLSAIHLRYFCFFTAMALTPLCLKSNNCTKQSPVLHGLGYINQSKQTALLNFTPLPNYCLAMFKVGRQLFAALTHHKGACLNHYLDNTVMNDNHWSLAE